MLITLTKADLLGAASNSVYNLGHFAAGGLVAFAVQKAAFKIFNLEESSTSYTALAVRGLAFSAGIAATYSLMPWTPVTCVAFTKRKFLEIAVMFVAAQCINFFMTKIKPSNPLLKTALKVSPIANYAIPFLLFQGANTGKSLISSFSKHYFSTGVGGAVIGSFVSLILSKVKGTRAQLAQINQNPHLTRR